MATNRYVKSTTGNDANGGTSWADAKATTNGALAIAAAGDTINQSGNAPHAESATSIAITAVGTLTAPIRIISVNDGAAPPTSLALGASLTATNGALTFQSAGGYIYGNTLTVTTGANNINLQNVSSSKLVFDTCSFLLTTTGGGAGITTGIGSSYNASSCDLINCGFKFGAVTQAFYPQNRTRVYGGSLLSGGSSPTSFIGAGVASRTLDCEITGLDLTNASAGIFLCNGAGVSNGLIVFRGCKMPAAWSGGVVSTAITSPGWVAKAYNCDSGDTNYRLWIEQFSGSIRDETTKVRSGGASDGTTPIAWKMVTNGNAAYPACYLESDPIAVWNTVTGATKTVTVEILHDSLTGLTKADAEIVVVDPETSGFPLSTVNASLATVVTAVPATWGASSATWTTTGITNVNKQQLSLVTGTITKAGPVYVRVRLYKASYTIYADPVATIS